MKTILFLFVFHLLTLKSTQATSLFRSAKIIYQISGEKSETQEKGSFQETPKQPHFLILLKYHYQQQSQLYSLSHLKRNIQMLGTSLINHQESNSCNILQRMCEQIDQQVQILLNNLSTQDLNHLNIKVIDKCISTTKNAILRILGLKLPQIAAIQQKYKRIIIEINEDLESQRARWKQLSSKYQQLILENDRFKMQTVHFNDLYQCQKLQKIELVKKLESAIKNSVLEDLMKEEQEKKYGEEANREYREQYFQESKKKQRLSNQRILGLLEEKKGLQNVIEENEELIKLLKQQISSMILENEKMKSTIQSIVREKEQQTVKHGEQLKVKQEELLRIIGEKQKQIKQKQEKILQGEAILQLKMSCIASKDQEIAKNQAKYLQLQARHQDRSKQVVELKQKEKDFNSTIAELSKKCDKIGGIQRIQQALQHKYTQKISILTKYTKQQSQKVKYLKKENDRLYQGMEHFATKQVKLLNQLQALQNKVKGMAHKLIILSKEKMNMRTALVSMKAEITTIKKLLTQQLDNGFKNIIRQFKGYIHEFIDSFSNKLYKKIQENNLKWQSQNEELVSKSQKVSLELKVLQQRTLQSEMNASRVANALVESNKDITNSIAAKDERIRSLEKQLRREKEFNQDSVKKISAVMKKFELRNELGSTHNYSQDLFIERKIANHRLKLLGLENEIKALTQK